MWHWNETTNMIVLSHVFSLVSYCAFSLACDDHWRRYCLWTCSNNISDYFKITMMFFRKLECIVKICNHIILYDTASMIVNNNGWINYVLRMKPLNYWEFNSIYSIKIQLSSHQNFNKHRFLCQTNSTVSNIFSSQIKILWKYLSSVYVFSRIYNIWHSNII